MPGEYDARIKDLSVVSKGTSFTVGTLGAGQDFDVVADIEVGPSLNAVITRIQVWASVGNQTQLTRIQAQTYDNTSPGAASAPRNQRIVIPFNALTGVNEGDLVQAVATLKITTGALTDFSDAASEPFVYTS